MSFPGALGRQSRISNRLLPVAIILAASLILCFPLFRQGLPLAHDTEEHLQRYVCFVSQISKGEICPRWLAELNCGLGSPVMFVYAPLAYYVPAALRPLLRLPVDGLRESREVAVSMWIALAVSGLTAFLWLRSFVNRLAVAVCGALLYMAMPYHLAVDLYTRAAVAEVWAFAWMPLALYFAAMAVRTRTFYAMAMFAVSYALLVYTHVLTTLIFTPVVIAAAWFFAEKGSRLSALWCISLSLALGIGLSAAYLGPALEHEKYVSPVRLSAFRPTLSFDNNFMTLWRDWAAPGRHGDLLWKLSWIALSTLAVAIGAFAFCGKWADKMGRFWIAVAIGSAVMMFPASRFLWNAIPQLAAIQFPYRFNTILTVATVALVAMAADSMRARFGAGRIALAAGMAAGILVWAVSDIKTISAMSPWGRSSSPPLPSRPLFEDVLLGGWSQASDPQFLRQMGILRLSRQATVQGAALRQASLDRPAARRIRLTVDGARGWITVPLLFYHGWIAAAEDGQRLATRVASTGLMEIEVPAGFHRIHLVMPGSWTEKAAAASSALCALLIVILLAGRWRFAPCPTPSRLNHHAIAVSHWLLKLAN
jgi:hypothetical protein